MICNSKAFVDNAPAGTHLGLSTFYIKHKFFRQFKRGQDVELHFIHIVLFKSPDCVLQVNTHSAQFSLGSELARSLVWRRNVRSLNSYIG